MEEERERWSGEGTVYVVGEGREVERDGGSWIERRVVEGREGGRLKGG